MSKMNLILIAMIGSMVSNALNTKQGIYINTDLSIDERNLEDPQGVYVNTDSSTEERDLAIQVTSQYTNNKNRATSDYTDAVNEVTAAQAAGQTDKVVKSAAEAYKIAAIETVTAAQAQINQYQVERAALAVVGKVVNAQNNDPTYQAALVGLYVAEGNQFAAKGKTYERKGDLFRAKDDLNSAKTAYATAKTAYATAKARYNSAKTQHDTAKNLNLASYGNKSLYTQAVLTTLTKTANSNRKRTEGLWAALA